jgi:hypothetical protein
MTAMDGKGIFAGLSANGEVVPEADVCGSITEPAAMAFQSHK